MSKLTTKFDGLITKIILAILKTVVDYFDDGKLNNSSTLFNKD